MTLKEIKIRAGKEIVNIDKEIKYIKDTIKNHPSGIDINIPNHLLNAVIFYCDKNNIPVYNVIENTLSVASSYNALAMHEDER